MKPIIVVGAGGFGREVLAIIAAINAVEPTWDIVGVLDDDDSDARQSLLARMGATITGPVSDLASTTAAAVLAIGSPSARSRIDGQFPANEWATIVHPQATLAQCVRLREGGIVAPGARLSIAVTAGRHIQVDQNATVGHDTLIGDHVRLNPQACVSGSVTVGDRTLIGAGAVVLEGRTLGSGVIVGAGAVVTSDVVDGATVKGVPAR